MNLQFESRYYLVIGLCVVLGGCQLKREVVQTGPQMEEPVVSVEAERCAWESSFESKKRISGTIKPKRRSDLSFERIGRVDRVMVAKGDRVEAGQVLAVLNSDIIVAQIRKLKAELSAAKAQLAELRAGPRTENIEAAKYVVAEQSAQLDAASKTLDRRKRLLESGAISREDLEMAEGTVKRLEAARSTAQKNLEDIQLGTRSEKIATQESVVASIEESILAAKVEIEHSEIRSPYRGTIVERLVHEGNVASPGAIGFVISETSDLEAHFGVSPEVASRLVVGQKVELEVRGKTLHATLTSIVPNVDERTRTIDVISHLASEDVEKVIPGDLAQLTVRVQEEANGYWISSAALIQGTRGLWDCFVIEEVSTPSDEEVGSTGVVSKRAVEILQTQGDRVLVRGGLSDGDIVVSSLPNRLVAGQRVRFGKGESR